MHAENRGGNTMHIVRVFVAFIVASGLALTGPIHAQEKGKESAPVTKVLLENAKVRVTQSTFKPGDVSRTNRGPRVNHVLVGGTLERTTKDGKKETYTLKKGETLWREADSDVVKNVGKTNFTVYGVTLK
jgi:quercetin dioxygenase-like cupin family protein